MMRFETSIMPSKVAKGMSKIRVVYRTDEYKWGQTILLSDDYLDTDRMLWEIKSMKQTIRERVREYNDTKEAPREE
jgi:hypothetical protein